MRWNAPVLALVFWLVVGPAPASTDPAPDTGDAAAIRSVIERQLQAFRADDVPQAFSYASPAIQSIFKDPDTFMSMVRAGFQPVYRPREYEFRDLVTVEGRWTQRVLVVGPDGVPVVAQYVMERQPDGSWRIDGCVFERSTERTT
jgi:ketosteroid isomerase-like protein